MELTIGQTDKVKADPITRKIYLIRHAQSAGGFDSYGVEIEDQFRPLTIEGQAQAKQLGKEIRQRGFACDKILISPATRTRQTGEFLMQGLFEQDDKPQEGLGLEIQTEICPILYHGMPGDYFDIIQKCDDKDRDIMIIGHNPTCAMLSLQLTAQAASPADLNNIRSGFSQSQMVVFEFEDMAHWADIAPQSAILATVIKPAIIAA